MQAEDGLGDHRAAEQQAEVDAEDRDDRGQRGAEPVLATTVRSGRPLARAVRM